MKSECSSEGIHKPVSNLKRKWGYLLTSLKIFELFLLKKKFQNQKTKNLYVFKINYWKIPIIAEEYQNDRGVYVQSEKKSTMGNSWLI